MRSNSSGSVRGPLHAMRTAALALAVLSGTVPLLGIPGTAQAAAPSYDPITGASTFPGGVYASVLADGLGNHHAVAREDGITQRIVYRRSADGGRTWPVVASFQGDDGGGTRPSIAVSGTHVAIAFIGAFCQASLCGEAPYLATSSDSGASWGGAVRLDAAAFNVSVGVDGPRTWVAWEGRDAGGAPVVQIRGTDDGARSFFRTASPRGYMPRVVAGGGVGAIAFTAETWDPVTGRSFSSAVRMLRDATLVAGQDLPRRPDDIAVADGRVHFLLGEGTAWSVATAAFNGIEWVRSAPVPAIMGTDASLTARRGLVAVAAVESSTGITRVATSSNNGASFGAPVVVGSTKDRPYRVEVSAAVTSADVAVARFDWSVPERYKDSDGDGLADPANDANDPAIDASVVAKDELTVTLDGCASLPSPGATLRDWQWTVGDTQQSERTCRVDVVMENGLEETIDLVVTDSLGRTAETTLDVLPRDLLVVSIGDSVASGEGSPHVDATVPIIAGVPVPLPELWQDNPCHRTAHAGPAQAALALEKSDPRSRVTFVQLACSGASISDVPAIPGAPDDPADDSNTGGLLDKYWGVEPKGAPARESQMAQLKALRSDRPVDALMVSIGANDVEFAKVVEGCLKGSCLTDGTAQVFDGRVAGLQARYAALASAIEEQGIPAAAVHITEYFDATSDDLALPNLRCVANGSAVVRLLPLIAQLALPEDAFIAAITGQGLLDDDEALWAREHMTATINAEVRAAAVTHGWTAVGGLVEAFRRHGYCASDPWIASLYDSFSTQHDKSGAFHPNRAGQAAYGRALGASLTRSLLVPAPDPDKPAKSRLSGDLFVTTGGSGEITVAAVRDTGARPMALGSQRVDRVALGDGMLAQAGRPAADRASAVVLWTQLDGPGVASWRTLAAQVALAENIAVKGVRIAQAPIDGTILVANRPAVVLATVDAKLAGPQTLDVRTILEREDGTQLFDVTEPVRVVPGRNVLVLPSSQTIDPALGDRLVANVTVSDPIGVDSPEDNSLASTDGWDIPAVVETRPVKVLLMPADVADGVSCATVQRIASAAVERAAASMPVTGKIEADVACTRLAMDESEYGMLDGLTRLDHIARIIAYDHVVAVVPAGWLQYVYRGAVGAAPLGGHGIVIEQGASPAVLAHEMTHNLALDHVTRPAGGVWVARRTLQGDTDYMHPNDLPQTWAGGATWDSLVGRIGGPESAPRLPDPEGGMVWIRGYVTRKADGKWTTTPAQWVPAGTTGSDGREFEELEIERMTARQVAGDGSVVVEETLPMGEVDGMFTRTGPTGPGIEALAYAGRIAVRPATAEVQVVLDGVVVESRTVSAAAPTVTVTAPSAGLTVARRATLTITWDAADADGDPLTADVLVSDDDGATWNPIALGVPGSSHDAVVPADLDGDAIRIRVIVSDGVRSAMDDSGSFTVTAGASETVERIAFVRMKQADQYRPEQLLTMDPDGSNEVQLPLPEVHTCNLYNNGEGLVPTCDLSRAPLYHQPAWTPAGDRLLFSSDLMDTRFGGTATATNRDEFDWVELHLWSVKPDGSDLRRITQPVIKPFDPLGPAWGTQFLARNLCVDVSPADGRLAWLHWNPTSPAIWVANADGSEAQEVLRYEGGLLPAQWPTFVATGWPSPTGIYGSVEASGSGWDGPALRSRSCPEWSPDGSSLATVLRFDVNGAYGPTGRTVAVMAADGTDVRVLSKPGLNYESLDWLDGDTLVASRQQVTNYRSYWTQETIEVATGVATVIVPEAAQGTVIEELRVAPDATLYGKVTRFLSGAQDANLGIMEAPPAVVLVDKPAPDTFDAQFAWGQSLVGGGTPVPVVAPEPPAPPAPADAGGPYSVDRDVLLQLDAGASALLAAPGGLAATARWDLDQDGAFDDAIGPRPLVSFAEAGTREIRVRIILPDDSRFTSEPATVTVIDPPAPPPLAAPGASAQPLAAPVPADVSVTVEAGQETAVQLQTVGGGIAPFVVVAPPPPAELAVASGAGADPGTPGVASGPDGTVLVTPATGFLGTTTFTYAVEGTTGVTATATITVVGNRPPVAGDDTVAIDPAVRTEVQAGALLANDTDPDGDALRIASVTGATGGQAWLDPDRPVVVVVPDGAAAAGGVAPAAAGDVTFSYVVADADGAMATASVTAAAAGGPTPSPSATPAPTSTPRPTMSPTPRASVDPGSTSRPTVTTPPTLAGQPGTADPVRGSGPLLLLLGMGVAAGLGLLIAGRRRRGRRAGIR